MAGKKVEAKVTGYFNYKGYPMVNISGNVARGQFALSKNKVAAILENIEELKKFADGFYDDDIKNLADGESLELRDS